jgi:hypothetical protein
MSEQNPAHAPGHAADPFEVVTDGNVTRVGIDPVSRMSANVIPADQVAPSITWSDQDREGFEKEVVVMDQSDSFDDSLRTLARERDFAIERANACAGPDGNVMPGMEGELTRWTDRIAGLEHSLNYQVEVTKRERQKRYEDGLAFVAELEGDAAALNDQFAKFRIRDAQKRRGY